MPVRNQPNTLPVPDFGIPPVPQIGTITPGLSGGGGTAGFGYQQPQYGPTLSPSISRIANLWRGPTAYQTAGRFDVSRPGATTPISGPTPSVRPPSKSKAPRVYQRGGLEHEGALDRGARLLQETQRILNALAAGERPYRITEYSIGAMGLSASDLYSMGYSRGPTGTWYALPINDYGPPGGGGGGGGGGGWSFGSTTPSRSTIGLVNWRY